MNADGKEERLRQGVIYYVIKGLIIQEIEYTISHAIMNI